jgi:transcriptional regulator with XRE-family HTH domain
MPKPGNKTAEMVARREEVARRYLRGLSQQAIAADLNIGQATVSRDLKALQSAWQESALIDIDAAKARELARIDELERTYWAEWSESREARRIEATKKVQTEGNAEGEGGSTRAEAMIRKEERLGDPRYLEGVRWCIQRRCDILGIDAPKKVAGAGKDGALHVVVKLANDDDDHPT